MLFNVTFDFPVGAVSRLNRVYLWNFAVAVDFSSSVGPEY